MTVISTLTAQNLRPSMESYNKKPDRLADYGATKKAVVESNLIANFNKNVKAGIWSLEQFPLQSHKEQSLQQIMPIQLWSRLEILSDQMQWHKNLGCLIYLKL